jgi:hypothetical protein
MDNYDETDSESNDSWDDSDDEIDNENVYEPEEPSLTKYNLVLCELYNRNIHGDVDGEINYHYLTFTRLKKNDNNFIRRFPNHIKLEIAECLYLPSEHCVSILKTFWLRLIQRIWKKIYIERKSIIKKRSNPNALFYKQIYGKWPNNCLYYPQLKGMLSNLSKTSFTTF